MSEPSGWDPDLADLDAELDAVLERLLAQAEADEAWQRQEAKRRHPSARVVREVGHYVEIESIDQDPDDAEQALQDGLRALGQWAVALAGTGLMALGVAVGITPPLLSGHTILGCALILAGGWMVVRIDSVARGDR